MKAVLISIHPRHCEKIASGKKTVEVRKTTPKIPTPFKCYIYQTEGMSGNIDLWMQRRRVVGEFVCDRIETIRDEGNGFIAGGVQQSEWHSAAQTLIQAACLTEKELKAYLGNEYGYCWHISDLKIYDKPKELGEFRRPDERFSEIRQTERGLVFSDGYKEGAQISHPPQSWCYVEVDA